MAVMRSYMIRAVLLAAAAGVVVTGCESGKPATANAPAPTAMSEPPPLPQEPPVPPTAIATSPGGVTTVVDVPSDATESQFGQACHAATVWMAAQHTERAALVEPYLKLMQQPGIRDPGNFNTPWADLTPGQQAGVIMAATTAAKGECG